MDEKKQIEEMADFLWKNTLIHTEDLCHDVAETLVIANYHKQSEWISVDKRLPLKEDANRQGDVLAITRNDGRVRTWSWDWLKCYPRSFTHWMPLPEPPKMKGGV